MVKATADVERFLNSVEALVQMHSGPVQPSGIAYEKVQMEYIAALLDVIVFSRMPRLPVLLRRLTPC